MSNAAGSGGSVSSGFGSVDVISPLVWHMLGGASALSRAAFDIEALRPDSVSQEQQVAHKGFVIGAIVETVSALETEAWELLNGGPDHHRGTTAEYQEAREFLQPLADMVDGEDVLSRYETILHLLRRPPLDRSAQPWQDAALLVRLRNEIVHYKAKPGRELERTKFIRALQDKRMDNPPFLDPNLSFYPHRCLSASCAAWSVETGTAFLDAFFERLGAGNSLDPFRHWIRPRL